MACAELSYSEGLHPHPHLPQKSWRKVWGLLYAGGPSGVARLESWEVRDGGLGPAGDRSAGPSRRGERRVIRLADCVSVLPADGENCPRDTGAFLLTTTERSHLLAAQHRQAWMGPICQLAFPVSTGRVGRASTVWPWGDQLPPTYSFLIHSHPVTQQAPAKYLRAWETAQKQKPQNSSQMATHAVEKMKGWVGTRSEPGAIRQDGRRRPLRRGQ